MTEQTRAQETATVKAALRDAGIQLRSVGHGTGTAHGWLHIYLGGTASREDAERAIRIAQRVTGRTGDYDGRIRVDLPLRKMINQVGRVDA